MTTAELSPKPPTVVTQSVVLPFGCRSKPTSPMLRRLIFSAAAPHVETNAEARRKNATKSMPGGRDSRLMMRWNLD